MFGYGTTGESDEPDIAEGNYTIWRFMIDKAYQGKGDGKEALKVSIIKTADPIKEKEFFCYYRLAKGISGILAYAKEGVRLLFWTKRPAYRQFCLKLVA